MDKLFTLMEAFWQQLENQTMSNDKKIKSFIDEGFLLDSTFALELYVNYAANRPIIDYHCHLSPTQISNDYQFKNITEIWIEGDHYKWRQCELWVLTSDSLQVMLPPKKNFCMGFLRPKTYS